MPKAPLYLLSQLCTIFPFLVFSLFLYWFLNFFLCACMCGREHPCSHVFPSWKVQRLVSLPSLYKRGGSVEFHFFNHYYFSEESKFLESEAPSSPLRFFIRLSGNLQMFLQIFKSLQHFTTPFTSYRYASPLFPLNSLCIVK